MWLGLGDRDPLGATLGVSRQAGGGGTAGLGIGWVSGGQKPSPKPQLLALALSWGADYRLLVGGGNRLLCWGQKARLGWEN